MYKRLIRPILFRFPPEKAHNLTLRLLGILRRIPLARPLIRACYQRKYPALEREVFGLHFPHPVGLAGGLDKDGAHYNILSDFGFSFVEIGSLTPLPQEGQPRPRLFRIPRDRALVNRMGINNKGVLHAIDHLKKDPPRVIIGANIAKNSESSDEQTPKDYDRAFSLLYDFAGFFVINVSCPNVQGLTGLQDVSYLSDILDGILDKRMGMEPVKPVLLKLSPDIGTEELDEILDYALRSGIDGIVAGNTTRHREGLTLPAAKIEAIGSGGLSGAPLFLRSLEMVRHIHEYTQGRLPIIAVGGIMSPQQAQQMLDAGASLIELYTGFIYEGPALVKRILKYLDQHASTRSS